MSDSTSLPDLGFLIGPDGGFQDDYVPPEVPAFDVEDALGSDAWPEIAVPGGASGAPSAWEPPASSGGFSSGWERPSRPGVDPERVHVIHNGIDLNKWHAPVGEAGDELRARVLAEHGIDPSRRTVVFVGRITRQKGLPYFLRAARLLPDDVQLVLCAGAPDTPEIAAEVEGLVAELRATRSGVVLISEMLPQPEVAAILSAAQVFITPSVYEPLGIVNLEAMALGLPVVGTATGGIPDVILDGETGYLVPIDQMQDGTGTPLDPHAFEEAMADRLVRVLDDPELGRRMGEAGLVRARDHFSWEAIGVKTAELYRSLV